MKNLRLKIFLFILGLGVVAYLAYTYLPLSSKEKSQEGTLRVSSFPVGEVVYLDGEELGKTPLSQSLIPGFYSLVIGNDESGVGSWKGKVKVSVGSETVLDFILSGSHFTSGAVLRYQTVDGGQEKLAVTSTPSFAQVLLNGEEVGETPYVGFLTLKEGKSLGVRELGYVPYVRRIESEKGRSVIVDVSLGRDPLDGIEEVASPIPVKETALSEESVIKRQAWQEMESSCSSEACSNSEWKQMRAFKVVSPQADLAVEEWLKGLQIYLRHSRGAVSGKESLRDLPFAYFIDSQGKVYRGSSQENLNISSWDLGFLGEEVKVETGDYLVLFLLKEEGAVGSRLLEKAGQLRQMISPVEVERDKVKVGQTPTGFLNMRSGPSLNASVVGKVYPGASYELLEERKNWLKIKVEEGVEAWIYSKYAQKE